MDQESPDEYVSRNTGSLEEQSRELLTSRHRAVVAMASGGCARYAFSMDVDFCLDRQGLPLIHYSSGNAHHHIIVTNSTMDFRIVQDSAPDGVELNILILTGMLTLVDPGDHDSIDRHARYFNLNVENYSRGIERLYRLVPSQSRMEMVSGKPFTIPVAKIIERNVWTPGEEEELMNYANSALCGFNGNIARRIVGIDQFGADMINSDGVKRFLFKRPTSKLSVAKRELKHFAVREQPAVKVNS